MGCGGNASSRQVDIPKNLTIHGHILDNQTRSLMACCQVSGVPCVTNTIDFLKGDNRAPRYLNINPTGHIPMLEEGPYKVMGGNHLVYIYLCKSKTSIASKLMPTELEQKVKGVIGWNIAKMMTPCQQLFRILYEPSVFAQPPTKEQFSKWQKDFEQCLKVLDMRLVDGPYLCGSFMTVADVICFNDISMYMELCGLTPKSSELSQYANLVKWFTVKMLSQ